MAKWLLVSHYLVVSALAASEAQLKFVPVPIENRHQPKGTVEPVRSSPSASSHHASVIPISNSSIRVSAHDITGIAGTSRGISRAIHSDLSHDPGRLHASASHQQSHREDRSHSRYGQEYHSGYNTLEEHSRNYRGLQAPRVDVDLHGSHYQGPSYRHHQGQGHNYRENRVEVRIDEFRRDRTQRLPLLQNRPSDLHGTIHSQRPFDSDVRIAEWQRDRDRRPQDRDFRQQDRDFPQQDRGFRQRDRDLRQQDIRPQDRDLRTPESDFRPLDRDDRQQSAFGDRKDDPRQRPDEGQSQSCGPQSPCLEPNGLFPVDGNCCGFVNCANCRPYTQRCAAGTVFDLDLWICNHERDTRQCAGNNRDCAFQTVNLRGQSQDFDHRDEGASHRGFDATSGGSSGGNTNGWEYASASEVKEVKKTTGKVARVKKPAKSSRA